MQTFLPHPSFVESARILDYRRLGKQRVEALQLIRAVTIGNGWSNHPAARQWRRHPLLLCNYGIAMSTEWASRGYEDNLLMEFLAIAKTFPTVVTQPRWLGVEAYHASHRSNLLRKDHVYYGQFGWSEAPDLPYYWPLEFEE